MTQISLTSKQLQLIYNMIDDRRIDLDDKKFTKYYQREMQNLKELIDVLNKGNEIE